MAKSSKKVPALNASSMADISFLLLTFFLLVSNMDVDSGLARRLPPPPQTDQQTSVDVQRRNLLIVLVNAQNETMVQNQMESEWYANEAELRGQAGGKVALKDKVKEFVLNTSNSSQLPELEEQDFGAPIGTVPVTAAHVVSIQNDATTSYKAYIAVQNEVVRAYNELRDEGAKKYFNTSYAELTEEQQNQINELYPQRISEAEPKNYGGQE